MDRFGGIKRVKISLKRNSYKGKKDGRKSGNARHNKPLRAKRSGDVFWRCLIAMLLILFAMVSDMAGYEVSERMRQDYIEIYAKD